MNINDLMTQKRFFEGDQTQQAQIGQTGYNPQAFSQAYNNLLQAEQNAKNTVQKIIKSNPNVKLTVPPVSLDPNTKKKILLGLGVAMLALTGGANIMRMRSLVSIANRPNATPLDIMTAVGYSGMLPPSARTATMAMTTYAQSAKNLYQTKKAEKQKQQIQQNQTTQSSIVPPSTVKTQAVDTDKINQDTGIESVAQQSEQAVKPANVNVDNVNVVKNQDVQKQ